MTTRRWLLLIWVCFLLRGVFYASLLPLWEGFDEYSHVAFLQFLAHRTDLPDPKQTRLSREVEESLALVPLPWTHRHRTAPYVVHDTYWLLPADERERRQAELLSLPRGWAQVSAETGPRLWEAQQPPLYYWLFAWPLRLLEPTSLPTRVFLLRYLNVLLASLVIPIGFLVARRVFGDDAPALGALALLTAMPELMINLGRVSNEGLAIVLFTSLVLASLRFAEEPAARFRGLWLGVLLGLGLLTKAYFLAAVPAVVVVLAWALWRKPVERRRGALQAAWGLGGAFLLAGWWYARNLLHTGSVAGIPEEAPLRDTSWWTLAQQVLAVDWRNALDSILGSHIWIGGWSFLQVRAWIYHLFELLVLLAALGLAALGWRLWRRGAEGVPWIGRVEDTVVLGAFYGFFWLALACHAFLLFTYRGLSTSTGWYLYAVVVPEVVLATLGLWQCVPGPWRRWVLPVGTSLFVLLDLYSTHFLLLPYYTGLIAHKPGGGLASFYPLRVGMEGWQTMLLRLQANKPPFLSPPAVLLAWAGFLAATSVLILLGLRVARQRDTW